MAVVGSAILKEETFGPATRPQEIDERIHPIGLRILAIARENGACQIGESGAAVVDLVRRNLVTVVPQGHGRFRVSLTSEGEALAATIDVTRGDGAELHRKRVHEQPRQQGQRWDR